MKTVLIKITFIASFILAFIACDNMGETDSRLAAVGNFLEPLDGQTFVLEASASASVYFEWDHVKVEDSGTAIYQIAFDKPDGDFSTPVYLTASDNNGFENHVTITHKQMNKIAGMMGIKPSDTGSFKWTVFSSKGTNAMKSGKENTITVTRLAGFADVPIDVFVTGEASEGGTDLSKAHKMKAVAGGEFEMYTKLVAGKPFYFTDGTTGTPREFYTADGLVKENGTSTVTTDGIYRITLDFNTGACTYALVTRIGFYFCPQAKILFDLPYIGYGVFQTKATVEFFQESWGRDERYKFRMFIKENGGAGAEEELEWGTLNQTDSRPTATSPESYYYLQLVSPTDWDNKWKLMGDFDGVPATYTIYLTADQPYTHSIVK
ncbi:SusE domain-containing protein [Parabacteroides bouchesdurhonensis]|uniref:SusE domain-containing protein n=1 Tax=Parabacteroides bouchesdurhonensis TaxID=1936995 RepID=UPI000C838D51|nr:SusE domain-containing protein [Parabacteroides bouchesdurhonensis]